MGVHYYPIIIGHYWPTKPVAGKIRLFVRPFANHSGDPQLGQFIRGLTDETIAQLGRLDPAHLGVIAATSSELLAGKSIEELGSLLHVQYILEGRVRRSGTQVRINTELIQVSDQTHIWADSYTGDMSDISGVQEKVAVAVAKQIHVTLPLPLSTPIKVDPAAYDAYLQGRSFWANRVLAKSIDAYEQAVRDDPNYAPAYAGLASAYRPPQLKNSLLRGLKFPSLGRPHGNTRTLLEDVIRLLKQYGGLDDTSVGLVGRVVLLSAVVDAVPRAPTVLLVGPDAQRAEQLITLLGCLCRHPLQLTGVRMAGLCSLPSGMRFTLLIQQNYLNKSVREFLEIAKSRDRRVPVRGTLIDLFGIQVIFTTQSPVDLGSNDTIEVPVLPSTEELPVLDLLTQRSISQEFQARLLDFRRVSLASAGRVKFDVSALAMPVRSMARALATATPDDAGLQSEVISLLKDADKDVRDARFTDLNCITAEAVLFALRDAPGGTIYVSRLTEIAQELLNARGDESRIEAGAFGRRLKSLGFTTTRDARGSKLLLTKRLESHVVELARTLGVASPVEGHNNSSV